MTYTVFEVYQRFYVNFYCKTNNKLFDMNFNLR